MNTNTDSLWTLKINTCNGRTSRLWLHSSGIYALSSVGDGFEICTKQKSGNRGGWTWEPCYRNLYSGTFPACVLEVERRLACMAR